MKTLILLPVILFSTSAFAADYTLDQVVASKAAAVAVAKENDFVRLNTIAAARQAGIASKKCTTQVTAVRKAKSSDETNQMSVTVVCSGAVSTVLTFEGHLGLKNAEKGFVEFNPFKIEI